MPGPFAFADGVDAFRASAAGAERYFVGGPAEGDGFGAGAAVFSSVTVIR